MTQRKMASGKLRQGQEAGPSSTGHRSLSASRLRPPRDFPAPTPLRRRGRIASSAYRRILRRSRASTPPGVFSFPADWTPPGVPRFASARLSSPNSRAGAHARWSSAPKAAGRIAIKPQGKCGIEASATRDRRFDASATGQPMAARTSAHLRSPSRARSWSRRSPRS